MHWFPSVFHMIITDEFDYYRIDKACWHATLKPGSIMHSDFVMQSTLDSQMYLGPVTTGGCVPHTCSVTIAHVIDNNFFMVMLLQTIQALN